jgi:hypothetical protein
MGTVAVAAMASCASENGALVVPESPLEECVYMGDKTEFAVWAPDADAAQLRLYHSTSEEAAFKTLDMKLGKDGLWKATVKEDVKGAFYTFQVQKNGQWLEETEGIAAKAVGVNGTRGAVIDWTETDPEGWDELYAYIWVAYYTNYEWPGIKLKKNKLGYYVFKLNLLKGYPYDGYVEFNDNNGNTTWSFYSYEIDDWVGRIIKVKPDSSEVEYLSWFS